MKVNVAGQFTALDPVDIKELCKGESDRVSKRMNIIRGFMSWAYFKESSRFTQVNNEEKIVVKRHFGYVHMLAGFGLFANATIYNAFFIGLYNFRTFEVMNMRSVPFPLKIGVSTLVAGILCRKLYLKQIYEPELYRVAVKYRPEFDKEYKERVEDASQPIAFN